MSQPVWKYIANLGDASPVEHDGAFLYVDETGVYDPELEFLVRQCDDTWKVYRIPLESHTYIDGVLSDNRFHPGLSAWYGNKISDVAESCGMRASALRVMLCSGEPMKRAEGYQMLTGYFGYQEFDQYPQTLNNEAEVTARYTLGELD